MDEVFGVVAASVVCFGGLAIIAALMGWMLMGIVSGMRGTARRMANHQCCDCENQPRVLAFHGIDEDLS